MRAAHPHCRFMEYLLKYQLLTVGREIALQSAKSQGETGEKTRGRWGGCAVLQKYFHNFKHVRHNG